MSEVAIGFDENSIENSINNALKELDLADIITDKIVAIKPNDTYATEQDKTGVTQGDTLQAVIRHIKKYNPKRLIVSGGAGAAETEDVFRLSGMMDVIEQEGVEFFDHNRPPFEEIELDIGPQKSVMVNPKIFEYETVISLAQHKVHFTATITMCMKNIAMSFPAADYYGHPRADMEFHKHNMFDDMQMFIVGMIKRFPAQLGIIVGHPSMVGRGPLGGKAIETGLTIASKDIVAADAIGARIMGFGQQAVRHLFEAGKLGLGESYYRNIKIKGVPLREASKIFSEKVYGEELRY